MDRARVSTQTTRYAHSRKNVLTTEEAELLELANLAGITIDQNVFKILVDLLRMNVTPAAIDQMLQQMAQQQQRISRGTTDANANTRKRVARTGKENRAK